MAMIVAALRFYERQYESRHQRRPPIDIAVPEGACLAAISITGALVYRRRRWPRPALARMLTVAPKAISAAPHDASTLVLVEGRVACTAQRSPHSAPLDGGPCVYHRVLVEQWSPHPSRRDSWTILSDQRCIGPLNVIDESGFVLVERSGQAEGADDPVEGDLRLFSHVIEHDSPTGLRGLAPEARAYVETNRKVLAGLDAERRLRVTELVIREGDVVSLVGAVEKRPAPPGSYRPEDGATILVMDSAHSEVHLVPARLSEIRRLITLQHCLTAVLVVTALLALGHAGLGALRMVAQ
jgi:hypothetical protein